MYKPNSKWTWAFLLLTVTQAIIGLGLEGYVFAQFQSDLVDEASNRAAADKGNYARAVPTLLALLIFAFIYQLVLVWDALRSQNTIQVIGITIMNFGVLVYTAIQKDQVWEAVEKLRSLNFIPLEYWPKVSPSLTALPCVIALFTVLLAFVTWKLYGEFGWTIYKQIGADLRLKKAFMIYQIYIALLKFDFFLFLGYLVQFLVLVGRTTNSERWLTVAAIPITIVLLLIAAWCTQREHLIGMLSTMIVYFLMIAYFVYKLVRMYNSPRAEDYEPARKTLTVFAAFTLLLLVFTIVIATWCTINFNKGLKPHLTNKPRDSIDEESRKQEIDMDYSNNPQAYQGHGGRPQGSRMEID